MRGGYRSSETVGVCATSACSRRQTWGTQYMQGSSQSCLPRPSGAAATGPHPPAAPSSVLLAFLPTPVSVPVLRSWDKTKSPLYTQLPDSGLFTWQHPKCGAPQSPCNTADGREMDSSLQSLHKSYNEYSSINTNSSCMQYLPAWFKLCCIVVNARETYPWRSKEAYYLKQYPRRENRLFTIKKVLKM